MSFGYAIGDFVLLTQLAWDVVQNSRKACGAHDELTSEATSLHIVLRRLEIEVSKPNSIVTRSDDSTDRKEELAQLSEDCRRVLRTLDGILKKYNALSEEKRSVTKLWKKVQFGNGEMLDLAELRLKIATSTSALTLFLNLLSIGSQGKVESYMESQGDELKEMRRSLNWITASMQAKAPKAGEGSILTTYAGDDKAIWKDFRRELIREGFSSEVLERHMETIKGYVMELGNRGALDDFKDDFDVEEAFLEDMAGLEVSENMNEQEHLEDLEHEAQKRSKFDTLDGVKWSEEHSVELAANTPEESLDNAQERRSGMECEETSEQILERRLRDDTKRETDELEMQTHTEPQDSGEALESIGNEALQSPRQGFEYLSNIIASTLDDDNKPVSSEFTTAVPHSSQTDSYSSKPGSREGENISMNNLDGTAVDINSVAREPQTLATDPITTHKLLEFEYDLDLYIHGTSESLIGTNQLFFGPYKQHGTLVRPWISMQVIVRGPLFRRLTSPYDNSPVTYRPHSLCHLILCLSRWYAQSKTSVVCSTYPPNILSSVMNELQLLFSRAIAYHSRMIISQFGGASRPQFLSLFRSLLVKFYLWVKLGVRHMLYYDKGDESFNATTWWILDENVYYWHRKEGDLVSVPIPEARQHARPLKNLGTRAYSHLLHGLFEDENPARSGRAHFADLMIKLQSLLLYFKRWCEEDLLEDENTRLSTLLSPDMSDAAVASAVCELKMCKLALETWSFQNDYSEDSVKEQRFTRGENSLSAILQRSDESQLKLWRARVLLRTKNALRYNEHIDKKSPDPRYGIKNSKKKKKK